MAEMDAVVPGSRLEALIEPHYPKSGKVGRPPIGVPRMLRMYFLQQWYTLADEALVDALYDSTQESPVSEQPTLCVVRLVKAGQLVHHET